MIFFLTKQKNAALFASININHLRQITILIEPSWSVGWLAGPACLQSQSHFISSIRIKFNLINARVRMVMDNLYVCSHAVMESESEHATLCE